MRAVTVRSPLAGGEVSIAYRDLGDGPPLVFLHGGWGYAYYPLPELPGCRVVIPDRTGYGGSPRLAHFPPNFHVAAAAETLAVLAALGISRCAVWGHSDGAVIAARLAIDHPALVSALVLEALHVDRTKGARPFFAMMADDPDAFGERVTSRLAAEHGESWRVPIQADGRAWQELARAPAGDLFDHRLATLRVPTLLVQGTADPRAEAGELDRFRREVPHARVELVDGGGHAPHSERASSAHVVERVTTFLRAHEA